MTVSAVRAAVLAAIGLALSSCAPPESPVATSAPSSVSAPAEGWPTNGGDLFNRRYSPLTGINRDNVAGLKAVWRVHLDGSGAGTQHSGEGQPLVVGGVLYIPTGADDVFAIDVGTGKRLWKYEAHLDQSISTICCGWISRGVAEGQGRIYLGQLDGKLVALDEKTGAVVWSTQAERWQDGYPITSAPLYFDGLVITGFAGAEYTARGRVKAFDAATGELVWTFFTIPGPGETGRDSWPADNDTWKTGGATVWQTPAVDPDLGLLYFSTGNAAPDFNGAVRTGDNLFTSSVVAIDVHTGKYRWHFQSVHHDLWDYDLPTPVVLADVPIGGKMRKAIIATGKTGWLYILDRETGKPLIGIDERSVPQEPAQRTAATQPYPRGEPYVPHEIDIAPEGFDLVNQGRIFTPFVGAAGVPMRPSLYGGANWPPSSYDPASNLYYVCATSDIGVFRGGDRDFETPKLGQQYTGGQIGFTGHRSGIFAAMDVRTNTIAWRQEWTDQCYSGSAVTAGGLVFIGRSDGRLTALDSSNGHKLWDFQTGAGVNAPPSVFEHNGREYVAVYSAGSLFAGSPKGDSVWLFALDGTIDPVPAAGATAPAASAGSHDAVPGDVADLAHGEQVYGSLCRFCHGPAGLGGNAAPALPAGLSADAVAEKVRKGGERMPPLAATLSAADVRDVAGYVTERLIKKE